MESQQPSVVSSIFNTTDLMKKARRRYKDVPLKDWPNLHMYHTANAVDDRIAEIDHLLDSRKKASTRSYKRLVFERKILYGKMYTLDVTRINGMDPFKDIDAVKEFASISQTVKDVDRRLMTIHSAEVRADVTKTLGMMFLGVRYIARQISKAIASSQHVDVDEK